MAAVSAADLLLTVGAFVAMVLAIEVLLRWGCPRAPGKEGTRETLWSPGGFAFSPHPRSDSRRGAAPTRPIAPMVPNKVLRTTIAPAMTPAVVSSTAAP